MLKHKAQLDKALYQEIFAKIRSGLGLGDSDVCAVWWDPPFIIIRYETGLYRIDIKELLSRYDQ